MSSEHPKRISGMLKTLYEEMIVQQMNAPYANEPSAAPVGHEYDADLWFALNNQAGPDPLPDDSKDDYGPVTPTVRR